MIYFVIRAFIEGVYFRLYCRRCLLIRILNDMPVGESVKYGY